MRPEKIVLFENHSFYRNRIYIGLVSQGYQVVCYADIAEIDDVIQRETPYLLIVGVPLEGTDPYLPTRFCQACYPWLPIIRLIDREEGVEPFERLVALQQGCTDVLPKRVERMEGLLQRVHDQLRPGTRVDRLALLRAYAEDVPSVI
jgi:DNA-binding response OmpR family regulator